MPSDSPKPVSSNVVRRRIMLALGLLLLVGGTLVFPFPMKGRLWGDLFDLAHAPVFCLALICMVGFCDPSAIGLPSRFQSIIPMTGRRVIIVAAVVMVVGLVGEYLQQFAGRNPSWGDVFANSAGLLAGLAWIVSRKQRGVAKGVLAMVAPVILVAVSVEPALEAYDSIERRMAFPLLASFERSREVGNWLPHQGSMSRTNEWATDGDYSLKLDLLPSQYPGVAMLWLESDWSEYRTLEFDVGNPSGDNLQLVVKIQDEQNQTNGLDYHDRFHQEVTVPEASTLHVVIDLAKVKAAPADREMVMTEINMIDIFSPDLSAPATFFIDQLRLKK